MLVTPLKNGQWYQGAGTSSQGAQTDWFSESFETRRGNRLNNHRARAVMIDVTGVTRIDGIRGVFRALTASPIHTHRLRFKSLS